MFAVGWMYDGHKVPQISVGRSQFVTQCDIPLAKIANGILSDDELQIIHILHSVTNSEK
jgi:hypothetical protein